MGIGDREAIDIIEQVDAEVKAVDRAAVRVWYDADRTRAGVAFGNTILAFRVTNTSARATESVVITVQHPLTQELVALPPIRTLNKDSSKYTETDLVFERVGRHSIRVGWVEVRKLTGASMVYRFEDVVRLNAENHEASRSHIQSISQTIQTHGGGVVSAGGLTGSDAASGMGEAWEEIRLSLSTADAFREAQRLAGAKMPMRAPEHFLPATVPEAPSNLTAVPQSPTSALLTWTDNATDEIGFHVERSADGVAFTLMATLGAESASYLVAGLPAGSRCSFRVRAFNPAGTSPYSNVAGAVLPELVKDTPAPPLPPPQRIDESVTPTGGAATVIPALPARVSACGDWQVIKEFVRELFRRNNLPDPYLGYRTSQRQFGDKESPHNLLPSARAVALRKGFTIFFFFSEPPASLENLDYILGFPDSGEDHFVLASSGLSNQEKVDLSKLPAQFVCRSIHELHDMIESGRFT